MGRQTKWIEICLQVDESVAFHFFEEGLDGVMGDQRFTDVLLSCLWLRE